MNYLYPAMVTASALVVSTTVGCDCHAFRLPFDRQVAEAEQHGKLGTLSETEMRRVHSFLVDRHVSNEEQHRRLECAIRAIVDSGSMIWLKEFCRLNLEGEFGHYSTTVVWQFAVKNPDVFFASLMAEDDFTIDQQNPEQAFGTRKEVQDSIDLLEAFAATAAEAKKHRAEAWAAILRGMIKEYPQIIKAD